MRKLDNSTIRSMAKEDMKGNYVTAVLVSVLIGIISALVSGILTNIFGSGSINDFSNLPTVEPGEFSANQLNLYLALMGQYASGGVLAGIINGIIGFFLSLGFTFGFLDVADQKPMKIETILAAFNKDSLTYLGTGILKGLAELLPMIILIPVIAIAGFNESISIALIGVILAVAISIFISLALYQTPYILKDNPVLGPVGVLKKSNELMKGNKGKLVGLLLYYILLSIVSVVIFGLIIGFVSTTENVGLIGTLVVVGGIGLFIFNIYLSLNMQAASAEFYRYYLNDGRTLGHVSSNEEYYYRDSDEGNNYGSGYESERKSFYDRERDLAYGEGNLQEDNSSEEITDNPRYRTEGEYGPSSDQVLREDIVDDAGGFYTQDSQDPYTEGDQVSEIIEEDVNSDIIDGQDDRYEPDKGL